MKRKLTIVFLILLLAFKVNYAQTVKSITASNGVMIRFLEYGKPDNKKHPLIIFEHGTGERGTNIELVKTNGIADILAGAPNAILLVPQLPSSYGSWPNFFIEELIKYGKTINVDSSQIIITGLSLGGGGIVDYASQPGNSSKISAMVPVCPACLYSYQSLKNITAPTWAFVADGDKNVPTLCTYQLQGQVKNFKMTVYPGGDHGTAWLLAYKDTSLYKWMLSQYRNVPRDTVVKPPVDTVIVKPPVIDTVKKDTVVPKPVDTVIIKPVDTVIVKPVDTLVVKTWQKDTLRIITEGRTYEWVTEPGVVDIKTGLIKQGATTFTSIGTSWTIEMEDTTLACNRLPFSFAGDDTTFIGTTGVLSGKGWDSDGTIVGYKWKKIKGPTKGSISYSTKATTKITGLVPGVYTYQLTVTDNNAGLATDQVVVTVKAVPIVTKKKK